MFDEDTTCERTNARDALPTLKTKTVNWESSASSQSHTMLLPTYRQTKGARRPERSAALEGCVVCGGEAVQKSEDYKGSPDAAVLLEGFGK
jgi:hypothetical protein